MTCNAQIFERSCAVFPGGVNSPMRSFKGMNTSPLIAKKGEGDLFYDADEKIYIDFCCSWGSLLLGHAHPAVVDGVCEQVKRGSSFGIATEIEERLGSLIISLMPSVKKLRFVNSGTEATMTALRLARGYTQREKIVKFSGHYHGHSDALLIQAGSGVAALNSSATSKGVNRGVVADTICLPFNDVVKVQEAFALYPDQIAAVIVEPVTANMGVVLPNGGFLEALRKITQEKGALLIFDEVVTGFRWNLGGAAAHFGIEPDLVCLGKVIGGGFPVAAVGGKAEILDCLAPLGEVYQAGTLSGNPVAMRAGLETLKIVSEPGFYEKLNQKADRFAEPIRKALIGKEGVFNGCGPMFNLFFGVKSVRSKEDQSRVDSSAFVSLFHFLLKRGVYLSPSWHEAWFLSAAHTDEHIDLASSLIAEFVREYR